MSVSASIRPTGKCLTCATEAVAARCESNVCVSYFERETNRVNLQRLNANRGVVCETWRRNTRGQPSKVGKSKSGGACSSSAKTKGLPLFVESSPRADLGIFRRAGTSRKSMSRIGSSSKNILRMMTIGSGRTSALGLVRSQVCLALFLRSGRHSSTRFWSCPDRSNYQI